MKKFGYKLIAEEILDRSINSNEGIEASKIQIQERKLNSSIPLELVEFYTSLGKNDLFINGFQHFAKIEELFINDNKLVFLQENQSVVYWAVDLNDKKTIFQTCDQNFEENVEWLKEDFFLTEFLEMLLYFQCVMSDEYYHEKGISGFKYFASLNEQDYQKNEQSKHFIDNLSSDFSKTIRGDGLSIHWKPDTIILCFLDAENKISFGEL